MLAVMGTLHATGYLVIDCEEGLRGTTVWEPGNSFSEIYVTIHPTMIIMNATFDYFIFFSIPWRLNRILKTQKELDDEAKEKLDALAAKNKPKTKCCLCCKKEIKPKKSKSKKKKKHEEDDDSDSPNKKPSNQEALLRRRSKDEEIAEVFDDDYDSIERQAKTGVNKFLPENLKLITKIDKIGQDDNKQDVISERTNEEDSSEDEREFARRNRKKEYVHSPKVLIRTRDDGDFLIDKYGHRQSAEPKRESVTIADIDQSLRNPDF